MPRGFPAIGLPRQPCHTATTKRYTFRRFGTPFQLVISSLTTAKVSNAKVFPAIGFVYQPCHTATTKRYTFRRFGTPFQLVISSLTTAKVSNAKVFPAIGFVYQPCHTATTKRYTFHKSYHKTRTSCTGCNIFRHMRFLYQFMYFCLKSSTVI